jgi:hypothetical protein
MVKRLKIPLWMERHTLKCGSLIFQNASFMKLCRIWHQLGQWLPRYHGAGPSTSLDERAAKAYPLLQILPRSGGNNSRESACPRIPRISQILRSLILLYLNGLRIRVYENETLLYEKCLSTNFTNFSTYLNHFNY